MTEFNKSTQKKDWDALAEKQLAAIKRSTKASTEDALVRAAHTITEYQRGYEDGAVDGMQKQTQSDVTRIMNGGIRNDAIEEVALHIEKLQGFGKDTVDSLAVYIREMKK